MADTPLDTTAAIPPLIGWRIAEERQRLGLTQAEFANRLSIGPQKMRAIEAGSQRPLTMQLMAYLAHCGVDLHYVLIGQRVLAVETAQHSVKIPNQEETEQG